MDKHTITLESVLSIQVCSEGTREEALEWLQENSPAGTTGNWQVDERKNVAPVQCADDATRMHYVFKC